MPGRDGTGPTGMGPRTGRGLGNCLPQDSQTTDVKTNTQEPLFGWFGKFWGRGLRRGNRQGWRNRAHR